MPREVVIVSPTALDLRGLVEAGAAVDPSLGLRTLDGQTVHQIVRIDDDHPDVGRSVLSLHEPLIVANTAEIPRLLPQVTTLPDWASDGRPLWWIEALVPWRADDARVGLAVARELADRLGGLCVVQDGG
ncbi:hypothetical protein [Cellulomonas sp. URHE0023]|uniref:hypothetical protein n=1 Tax=Cellulomonas sp. URHE0023 TaxID=1380354 RepID=UPI0004884834|nr:hypothetical protein [Cellulomonas sp. URHE0023]